MKFLLKKREGLSHMLLLGFFLIFMILAIAIFISYEESQRAIYRTEDAAIVSMVSSALHDRYEYALGLIYDKEILCYYPGDTTTKYTNDDTTNMQLTQQACSFAFEHFKEFMLVDMPAKYLNVENPTTNDIEMYTKSFRMTNVRGDTAYIYDIVTGETETITPATGMVSTIQLEMEIEMKFKIFGEKTIKLTKTNKLKNRT